jgi:hypothetical protein
MSSSLPIASSALESKTMDQSPLLSLPNELLGQICGHLCWHCRTEHPAYRQPYTAKPDAEKFGLLCLVGACRRLRGVTEPFLYHYVDTCRAFDLYFFNRTLLSRPDLAAMVREVNVNRLAGVPPLAATRYPLHAPNALDPLQVRLRDSGVVLTRGTLDPSGCCMPTVDAGLVAMGHAVQVSMLLELAPNLQSFHLYMFSKDVFRMPPQLDGSDPSMASLKTLGLATPGVKVHPLDEIAPVLELARNLEVLHLDECTQLIIRDAVYPQVDHWMAAGQPRLENLSELHLTDTVLTEACFGNLLEWWGRDFPRLTSDEHPGCVNGGLRVKSSSFDEVVAGLRPWTHTLKELSYTMYGRPDPRQARYLHGLVLLREFQSLEALRVHTACLNFHGRAGPPNTALTSILPKSIRELRLFGDSNLSPALQSLLDDFKAGNFGALSRIEIDNQSFDDWTVDSETRWEARMELRKIGDGFRAVGVDFVVFVKPERPYFGDPEPY